MVQRIALIAFVFLITAGFTKPQLPQDGRGIYQFEPTSMPKGQVFQSQSGSVFSITAGFKSSRFFEENRTNHHARAEKILNLLSAVQFPNADISVAKLYATTREVILNVKIDNAASAELVRNKIIQALKRSPEVAFVGAAAQLQVQ